MKVTGTAFLAREAMVSAEHGAAEWKVFLDGFAAREPFFRERVLPISKIPAEKFLALNEALVERFYRKDPRPYWTVGIASATYALTKGQLRTLFAPGELRRFLQFTPSIWKGYFDAGELYVRPDGPNALTLNIVNVPIRHVYFEEAVMGFAAGGLELLGGKHPLERVRGFSTGADDVLYRARVD